MKGLILKDLYYMKNNFKIVLMMVVFYGAFFIRKDSYIIGIAMASFMIGVLSVGTVTIDAQGKWNKYALTMPLNRKTLISEKFIFINASVIVTFLLLLGITVSVYGMVKIEEFLTALSIFSIFIIFLNLQIFAIYRFGSEKAIIFVFIVVGVVAAIGYGIKKLLPEFTNKVIEFILSFNMGILSLVTIAVAILFILTMYVLSLKQIEKEEF